MVLRAVACVAVLLGAALAGGCSSSFGGGSPPSRTYVVMPNGQAVPAQTVAQPQD